VTRERKRGLRISRSLNISVGVNFRTVKYLLGVLSCVCVSVQTRAEWHEASFDLGSDSAQRARRRVVGSGVERLSRFRRQRRETFCRPVRQLEHQRHGDHLLIASSVAPCLLSSSRMRQLSATVTSVARPPLISYLLCIRGFYRCRNTVLEISPILVARRGFTVSALSRSQV